MARVNDEDLADIKEVFALFDVSNEGGPLRRLTQNTSHAL